MEKKHLLFGAMRDCREYAREKGLTVDQYKIVKHSHDFYGYEGVKLVYLGGPYTYNEYELYNEARRYFIAKGDIKDD